MLRLLLPLILLSSCAHVPAPASREVDSQIVIDLSPPVSLDIDFDPNTPKKVGKVRFDVGVDAESAEVLQGWILGAVEAKLDALVIELNTPGGSVSAGHRLARTIEESPVPIYCIVDGMAASMGMYLLQSCQHRLMTDRSVLMAHAPSLGGAGGQEQSLENDAMLLKVLGEALGNHVCHRMTLPKDECKSKFAADKEWWLAGDEALMVGAVDEVVGSVGEVLLGLRLGLRH